MAKLTQIEQLRRQKSRRRLTRNLLILALFGVVVLAVASLSGKMGKTELKAAMSDIKAEITSGSGFPVGLPVGTLGRMDEVGGALVVQTDTHLYTYNETGRQMLGFQHGMENPMLSSARDRLLAFDRGGTKLHLFSRSAYLQSMDSPFSIYDADLNAKGTFAVASGSDSYQAQVLVYDANFNNIFKWFSSEYPVIGVSLSDQKDAMAVGCVGVKNGLFDSRIKRFQFNMAEELGSVSLKPGELLLAVDYHGGGGVRALTDSRVVLFSPELKELAEYSFGERRLSRFEFLPDGRTLLELQDLTGEKKHTLQLLDNRLESVARFGVSGDLISVSADADYLYLADRSRLYLYGSDGVQLKTIAESALFGARAVNQKLYYATATELKMLDVRKAVDPKAPEDGKNKPAASKGGESKAGSKPTSSKQDDSSGGEDDEAGVSESEADASETGNSQKAQSQPDDSSLKPVADPDEQLPDDENKDAGDKTTKQPADAPTA